MLKKIVIFLANSTTASPIMRTRTRTRTRSMRTSRMTKMRSRTRNMRRRVTMRITKRTRRKIRRRRMTRTLLILDSPSNRRISIAQARGYWVIILIPAQTSTVTWKEMNPVRLRVKMRWQPAIS